MSCLFLCASLPSSLTQHLCDKVNLIHLHKFQVHVTNYQVIKAPNVLNFYSVILQILSHTWADYSCQCLQLRKKFSYTINELLNLLFICFSSKYPSPKTLLSLLLNSRHTPVDTVAVFQVAKAY